MANPIQNRSHVTYFIRTFGCQMNVADSLHYARILESLGCVRSESDQSCDILVVNTCSVRQKAEEKAISYIGGVGGVGGVGLEQGGIALVGCMATVRGEEIRSRFPQIRLVLPATQVDEFEDRVLAAWPELISPAGPSVSKPFAGEGVERFERFVPIIRGCSNRCTYCIVPRARGGEIASRPPDEIMREIDDLLRSGIKSITLLGQNVCAYGKDFGMASAGYGFPQLLADIRDRFARDGVWFKFLTSHPRDVSDDLINVIAGHPSFSRHFHLPLQAGDDEVLKRMARGYTSESFRALIRRICEKIPDMRLTTDLIVGFPGEDEPAFERTLEMVREIGFDAAFTFLYSPRAETPAEEWADPVPLEEKKRRLQALIEIQNGITLERASRKVGSDALVLVEAPATGTASRGSEMVAGRTREDEVVVLPGGPSDFGRMVKVKLTRARQRSFLAERLDEVPGDESSEAF